MKTTTQTNYSVFSRKIGKQSWFLFGCAIVGGLIVLPVFVMAWIVLQ